MIYRLFYALYPTLKGNLSIRIESPSCFPSSCYAFIFSLSLLNFHLCTSIVGFINPNVLKKGLAPVYLCITIDSERVEISTGITIAPKQWNSKKGMVKGSSNTALEYNKKLQQLKDQVLNIYNEAMAVGLSPSAGIIKSELDGSVELSFNDSHINTVCKDYFKDESFCRSESGDINLWKLYNLFTSANRNSYIDGFLDRSVNAAAFAHQLADALEHKHTHWFLR